MSVQDTSSSNYWKGKVKEYTDFLSQLQVPQTPSNGSNPKSKSETLVANKEVIIKTLTDIQNGLKEYILAKINEIKKQSQDDLQKTKLNTNAKNVKISSLESQLDGLSDMFSSAMGIITGINAKINEIA